MVLQNTDPLLTVPWELHKLCEALANRVQIVTEEHGPFAHYALGASQLCVRSWPTGCILELGVVPQDL